MSKVWSVLEPDSGGDYTIHPGDRVAALVSASLDFTLAQITDYLQTHKDVEVTYAWEQGTPTRDTYAIDKWLEKQTPDTTDNHRWVYIEGNYTGTDAITVGQHSPWPFTVYSVAVAFLSVDAQDTGQPNLPPPCHCEPAPARWPWALGAGLAGALLGWYFG